MTPYQNFLDQCEKRKIKPDIKEDRYLSLKEEYPLVWTEAEKACLEWLDDKGLKMVNRLRLRNFCNNVIKDRKKKISQNLERNQANREKYAHDKVRVEEEKKADERVRQEKIREKELQRTQNVVNTQNKEQEDYERVKNWCLQNQEKAREYMKQAEKELLEKYPFARAMQPEKRKGMVKVQARIMIKEKELDI